MKVSKNIKGVILLFAAGFVTCVASAVNPGTRTLTPETRSLNSFLKSNAKRGVMFGHHDDTVYGIGWEGDSARSDVKSVCGDYPALISFDLGRIELGHAENLDKVSFNKIRKEIINQYKRGGLVSLTWHLDNPVTGKDAWDVSDTAVVRTLLQGGSCHQKFLGWLDKVSFFLNSLQTAQGVKIPIIFRPFHENSGSWFWWGAKYCTPAEYKSLWQMTEARLQKRGVNNVLYAYSPGADSTSFLRYYPGDKLIDVIGFDQYQDGIDRDTYIKSMRQMLIYLTAFGRQHHKPLAVTETGYVTIPDSIWWTNTLLPVLRDYPVTWVLVWRNARERKDHFYAPYPGQKSASDFVRFYQDKRTLFLKDINKQVL